MRIKSIFIILVVLALFVGINNSYASSISASFNLINTSATINQSISFNISADFQNPVNYTVFLNSSAVLSSTMPANQSGYKILNYNVKNMPAGNYNAYLYLSSFNIKLNSTQKLSIKPYPDFTFKNDYPTTEIIKNYSVITVVLSNNGNTPLEINWSLPILRDISLSLDFKQSFPLSVNSNMTIPINLSLQKGFQNNISFVFTGIYKNYSITKEYSTELIKPVVNMSFYGINTTSINSTRELWVSYIKNYNNIPLNITMQFLLNFNGSDFYYNTSYYLTPNSTKIEVLLPKSTVENVKIFYPSTNFSDVTQSIFTAPKPPLKINIYSIIDTFGFVILTAVSIIILVIIHLRFNKKQKKK